MFYTFRSLPSKVREIRAHEETKKLQLMSITVNSKFVDWLLLGTTTFKFSVNPFTPKISIVILHSA